MKKIALVFVAIIGLAFQLSCNNTRTTPSDTTPVSIADSAQAGSSREQVLELPPLKENEEIVFESDNVRIVQGGTVETEGGVYNTLSMQPKNPSYKQFHIEGTILLFHEVVGKYLVISEGTDAVCMLLVYDLTTGERLIEAESFVYSMGIVKENDYQFSFYCYNDNAPLIIWNGKKSTWETQNKVPKELLNADLEQLKKKTQEYLFDGLALMVYQRVQVDIQKQKLTPLDEYKWGYAE